MPPGTVTLGEKRVRSASLKFDDLESTCYISGRFDVVAEFHDGSYGVMDFKTGNPNDDKTEMYSRQLHAYALALENHAEGALRLHPVSRLGLFYFTPDMCDYAGSSRQVIAGQMTWVEIRRDDRSFRDFLREVLLLLDGPLPAPESQTCDWCRYRLAVVRLTGRAGEGSPDQQAAPASPSCPQCGGQMQLRSGKFGEFWGCVHYPNCRGTRPA